MGCVLDQPQQSLVIDDVSMLKKNVKKSLQSFPKIINMHWSSTFVLPSHYETMIVFPDEKN